MLVLEDNLLGREIVKNGNKIAFGRQILIRHLHKYSFTDFLKEEIKRSRALIVIRYADFFRKIKHEKDNIGKNMRYSILLFPFLMISIFLAKFSFLFLITPLILFYLINFNFLRVCKRQFGAKFMLHAALIIPLDCLLGWCGIILGTFDFLGDRKV